MQVWRLKLSPNSKENAFTYCINRGIIGVGWPIHPEEGETVSWELYQKRYSERKNKKPDSTVRTLYKNMQIGDLCWIQAKGSSNYFLGVIEGAWEYDTSSDARKHDIVNIRKCKWVKTPIEIDQTPGQVINSFIGRGRALASIKDEYVKSYSCQLANQYLEQNFPIQEKKIVDAEALFRAIHWEDCEDVVGIYLQHVHNYILIPSTGKKSTAKIEGKLIKRSDGSTAGYQVKQGKTVLNLDDYSKKKQQCDKVFLFSTEHKYKGSSKDGSVVTLDRDELYRFARENPHMMSKRVRNWLDF